MNQRDDQRLAEIDNELYKVRELLKEYHSWKDPRTQKVSFPPGRYFNYEKMVEHEYGLLDERKFLIEQLVRDY